MSLGMLLPKLQIKTHINIASPSEKYDGLTLLTTLDIMKFSQSTNQN